MRSQTNRRYDRYRRSGLHVKRDKLPSYLRRQAERQYAWGMQPERGSTQARQRFAQWLQDVIDVFGEPPYRWSMSRLARESGIHRNNLYDWINMRSYPQAATLRRFCENLGLDYTHPARILGWAESPTEERHRDIEGFIRRARAEAAHPDTTEERRRVLEERIENAEASQRMQQMAIDLLREALGEDAAER